ncbi:MAG TPA: amidase family protein [Acidobacteriota bacterium]|nr:amidase family protein [Acidobacteriota bacterium]
MRTRQGTPLIAIITLLCGGLGASGACAPRAEGPGSGSGQVVETTIAQIHAAMRAGELTSRQLVEASLDRIDAYDKRGPALNAIVTVNPRALERADELDAALAAGQLVGPLHGIPMIVKDNYDTADMQTSAGSAALAGSMPPDDAFQVRRIREAGAIVLVKSHMAEWAFSPYQTVGSIIPGYTRNPYALNRVPAGSSGGTGAAVAASFGVVGLGTDTGNSIRGPSSHNLLAGIRSTMGLTSRDGIVPLDLDHDIGGPMARSMADAVAVFDVIAGYDPADGVTARSREDRQDGTPRRPDSYLDYLRDGALAGARIGVVRQLSETETTDAEIQEVFERALEDMRRLGAETIDVEIVELDTIPRNERWCDRFRYDLEAYLASLGEAAPYTTLAEIIESGQFHDSVGGGLRESLDSEGDPEEDDACQTARANGRRLADGVGRVMETGRLDALVYPTWSNPPRLIGDMQSPAGDNSQDLSPHTGFPAITVPMGFTRRQPDGSASRPYGGPGLPAGITFLSTAWNEARLIELAYSYEQGTMHRRPPWATPPLAE